MRNFKKLCLHLLFVLSMCHNGRTRLLSCKDESNQSVDWFINYKFPKLQSERRGSYLHDGKAYAYITSEGVGDWALSSYSIQSRNSMLGKTWRTFDKYEEDITYLFYNDDSPEDHKTAAGHLKGIVAFDGKTGFWLIHSTPRFGEVDEYNYPDSALTHGQMAFCMSFNVSQLNEIGNHLLYCNPNIYERQLTPDVRKWIDENTKSLFTDRPAFIRKEPFLSVSTMKSLGNQLFFSFAKDNQLEIDLYSDVISPRLRTSLFTETWRRGAGRNLPPSCESNYTVVDVVSIKMKPINEDESISFKSSEDHSKWAISDEEYSSLVCICDVNRMASQAKRGGGAICFKSEKVWRAFESSISETDTCYIRRRKHGRH